MGYIYSAIVMWMTLYPLIAMEEKIRIYDTPQHICPSVIWGKITHYLDGQDTLNVAKVSKRLYYNEAFWGEVRVSKDQDLREYVKKNIHEMYAVPGKIIENKAFVIFLRTGCAHKVQQDLVVFLKAIEEDVTGVLNHVETPMIEPLQMIVNFGASKGKGGFAKISEEKRLKYLMDRIKCGDKKAEKKINRMDSYTPSLLVFSPSSNRLIPQEFTETKIRYPKEQYFSATRENLEEYAKKGNKQSQKQLNYAARYKLLNFDEKSGETYLLNRVVVGDMDALSNLYAKSPWFVAFYQAVTEQRID